MLYCMQVWALGAVLLKGMTCLCRMEALALGAMLLRGMAWLVPLAGIGAGSRRSDGGPPGAVCAGLGRRAGRAPSPLHPPHRACFGNAAVGLRFPLRRGKATPAGEAGGIFASVAALFRLLLGIAPVLRFRVFLMCLELSTSCRCCAFICGRYRSEDSTFLLVGLPQVTFRRAQSCRLSHCGV